MKKFKKINFKIQKNQKDTSAKAATMHNLIYTESTKIRNKDEVGGPD